MNFLEKHLQLFLLFYLLIGGFSFYLLGATIDAIFIPTIDQSDGFCEEWTERAFRWYRAQDCIEFKNRVEELKYKHNKRMEKRSSRKVLLLFLLASGVTYLLMVLRPTLFFDRGDYLRYTTGMIATAVLLGVVIGFMMPIICQALLPPPAEWFPQEFMEIRRARVELILNEITEKIQLVSQEGKGP
jgi:cyanate permease